MGKQARIRRERGEQQRQQNLIQRYVAVATAVLPKYFRPDCCLNGTRVFTEAMRRFGHDAKPIVVDMVVMNNTWKRLMEERQGWPQSQEQSDEWKDAGGWALAIAGEETEHGWPHHLVAMLGNTLIDSSAGQASRPLHQIYLDPVLALPLVDGWPCMYARGETFVYYHPKPGIPFAHLPGYQLSDHNNEVIAEVCAKMRRLL